MDNLFEQYNINHVKINYDIEDNVDVNLYNEFSVNKLFLEDNIKEPISIINNTYNLDSYYKNNKKVNTVKNDDPIDKSELDLKSEYFNVNKYLTAVKTTNLNANNDLLKASINNNINQILILKKNVNSIFKNFNHTLNNDDHFNNILKKLNTSINDLSNYKNYKNNQLSQLVKFKNDFNKVKSNQNMMLLFTLPNILLRMYELGLVNEMIYLLILYLNYKISNNRPIIINKLDSEVVKVIIKLKTKYYDDLDNMNNFNSLLILNYQCNVMNNFIIDYEDEVLNDKDIIKYWMKLKLDKLIDKIDNIDKVIFYNDYGVTVHQDNENIIKRYCKNYYNFLLLDEDHTSNIFNILNTSIINNKHSNDFWKNWNNIITIIVPLLNELKDFEFVITELQNKNLEDYVDDDNYNIINTDSESLNNDYYKIIKFLSVAENNSFVNKKISINENINGDIEVIKTNIINKIILFTDSQLSKINDKSKYLNWIKSLTLFYSDILSIHEDIPFDIMSIKFSIINILDGLLIKDIDNIFLLEDWVPLKAFNNMTISSVLFYKIIEFHCNILITRFDSKDDKFIIDCINILITKYSTLDKELLILNNIESLLKIEIISSNQEATNLLSDFKSKTINKYITKDCLKLKIILNTYTPYKTSEFGNYWTTFTINNNIKISNNIVGALMNLDIIKNDIISRFSSSKLINNITENFLQIISDYFIQILDLNHDSNVSIDTLIQIGVDYLHILKHIEMFDDLDIKNISNDDDLVMKFLNKVWIIGFNRNFEDFNQYYNEICKYV